jgi:hypothetical protein
MNTIASIILYSSPFLCHIGGKKLNVERNHARLYLI